MQGSCGITKLDGQKDMALFLSVISRYCLHVEVKEFSNLDERTWTHRKGEYIYIYIYIYTHINFNFDFD